MGFVNIFIRRRFCLSDFDDYNDNKDNLEEIRYISSAYLTVFATEGLGGDSLTLTLYQADGTTLFFNTPKSFIAMVIKSIGN